MTETVFTYGSPALKFGPGAADEIGYDLTSLGAHRVLVITDAGVAATGAPARIAERMQRFGVTATVFDAVHIEPTDASIQAAVDWARSGAPWDAMVAVGGGSSIDTAKAVNLLLTNPGDLLDYVNKPVGSGRAPSRPLLPLVAVPTTTGTGAESTTICVLDVLVQQVKTGISHPRLRPTLAVVDPDLTLTQPAGVTASAGMDILCHALESYTARPYSSFDRKQPDARVPYCGANPVSDMWAERALSLLAANFRRAVGHGADRDARTAMSLAATFAGLGFGNAGVHIPHANAYPIAGQMRPGQSFHADGYPDGSPASSPDSSSGGAPRGAPGGKPLVPHGMAVSLTAPEAFRFTFDAAPERHLRAAQLLDPAVERSAGPDALPVLLVRLMRDIGMPPGISPLGYDDQDVDRLVEGALKQQRLLTTAPRAASPDDLAGIFRRSMTLWD
jgi:hydroxyacid-oxoacid transhydrogenase